MLKIRHQLILNGKEGEKVLMEQFVEWDIKKDELSTPIKQIGIMEWEDQNIVKPLISVKRQLLSDDEWDELTNKILTEKKLNPKQEIETCTCHLCGKSMMQSNIHGWICKNHRCEASTYN